MTSGRREDGRGGEPGADQPWYQNAVFYAVDLDVFRDGDGDGTGDFWGLASCLDYLAWLGVDALWLLPCYPSPNMDNGYDITDHYDIAPRLGAHSAFMSFMHEAERRGIRVVLDFVVHHTSMQHPWFMDARNGPRSKYYDYYVWTQDPAREPKYQPAFPGNESSVWQFDPAAGSYYLHNFYDFEPDLNTAHPNVQAEIRWIMDFWLRLGAAGFRIDAASFLRSDRDHEHVNPHPLLKHMREWTAMRSEHASLLAEANVPADQLAAYFGQGDEMHMLYNFVLNQYLYLALARQQAAPIAEGLRQLPERPAGCQWLNFLRNMDELTLDKLPDAERQEVFSAFAPEDRMRIFGHGIRRRLAPMFGGDRRRLELAYSLLYSLPGTPLIAYGDEIGMGDDLSLPERFPARLPMQWSAESPNGGFSSAPDSAIVRSALRDGPFGFLRVNVADQQREEGSFLHWMRRLIRTRHACPEIGRGRLAILDAGTPHVFAHACIEPSATVLALHNLCEQPQSASVAMRSAGRAIALLGEEGNLTGAGKRIELQLPGYGYAWLRVESAEGL